ncbi:MAG: M15 family metallopeptidase [Treponema sp.]|nr:M15 family metallopeptidase [Treponema sp.]
MKFVNKIKLVLVILVLAFAQTLFSLSSEPVGLNIFKRAYPDITFKSEYDGNLKDWKITMTIPQGNGSRTAVLYWCNGSMVPYEELKNKDKYWTLLYSYNSKEDLADPADFTSEQISAMKNFGSDDNRKNGAGTPMFFFDAIYDSSTRASLEKHLVYTKFLGKAITIHERIKAPLLRVEERINKLAETDKEVKDFLAGLSKNEAYYWRLIAGTNRKSFHSLGIAIDVQPKYYGGKDVYWSWAKDRDPENWMLTPLSKRWMPPKSVIKIFEDEGFIWGGKWAIWDNMHFEYHPELILNSRS